MGTSEEVLRLVLQVEKLPREDQDKIMHLVDLLSLVPVEVQDRTQLMLRELLESEPESLLECTAGIDEVIAYLERSVSLSPAYRGAMAQLYTAEGERLREC